jgi:hypothetical protein
VLFLVNTTIDKFVNGTNSDDVPTE